MAVSVDYRPARSRSALAALLTVLILVPTGYLFFRVWQHNDDERGNTKLEKQGVEYLTSLSPLISALAQSESAALTGNTNASPALTAATARVAAADQKLGDALRTHDRWAGLRDRITKLPATTGGPAAVFQAHVEAADLALALYDTVRNNSTLVRDPDNDLSQLQQAVAVDLPTSFVQVNRAVDYLAQLSQTLDANQKTLLGAQLAAAYTNLQTSVGALTDDLQAAVDETNSPTLSGSLVASLDGYRRGVETMSRGIIALSTGAGTPSASSAAATATAQNQLVAAQANLDGVLTREMTGLLNTRQDDLDNQRIEAIGAAALVLLLMLLATIVRSTGRRRRQVPVSSGSDTGRGATTGRSGSPPAYGNLIDPAPYSAGDPTQRERSGALR
jgi:hypothetical protein